MRRLRGKRGPQPTEAQAARFLGQAAFGATEADIAKVREVGMRHWIAGQAAKPRETTFDAIGQSTVREAVARRFPEGLDSGAYSSHPTNGHGSIYAWFAAKSATQLRARVAHALAQFIVVGNTDVNANNFWDYAGTRGLSRFYDVLHDNALGNYRTLLEAVSLNMGMANWLSHFKNAKATASTQPDENFAREVMQLFSIGLWHLNDDGSRAQPETPTYDLDDVRGLARVFTGLCLDGNWALDWSSTNAASPLQFNATYHESGTKEFLGVTIPINTTGSASLAIALDTLFNHASCPPFVCTRLIQFMTTSNPSPAYIARVVAVFKNNGAGVRGDLFATVKAILLDREARNAPAAGWGRMRGTMESLYGAIRALGVVSPTNNPIDDVVSNNGGGGRAVAGNIGENPTYSPSVFNFFGPDYVPPGGTVKAPELQTQTAVTVAGTVNELTRMPLGTWKTAANYPQWYSLVGTPAALVDRLSLVLAGDNLSVATKQIITTGITGMATSTDDNKRVMIGTAVGLVLASAEARVQK
jgi:uncharacterized protein (DUF1800 family)